MFRDLLEMVVKISSVDDTDEVLKMALAFSVELLDADRALIATFDDHQEITRCAGHKIGEEAAALESVSQSLIRRVLELDDTVLVSDIDDDETFENHHSVNQNGIQFMVGVPIRATHGPRGVLYVDSLAHALQVIPERVEMVEMLAGLVANHLRAAHAEANLEEQEHIFRDTVHDMRLPLTTIVLTSDLLERQAPTPDAVEMAADVKASANHLKKLVSQALDIGRIDDGANAAQVMSPTAEIRRVLDGLRPIAKAYTVTLELDDSQPGLPSIHTVRGRLDIVVDNLVFSAIRYCEPDSTVTIRITSSAEPGPPSWPRRPTRGLVVLRRARRFIAARGCQYVTISVHNEGQPFPDTELPHLFRSSLQPREDGLGAGSLSLSIAAHCVDSWGGSIWATSSPDEGTCFHFTVPTHVTACGL